MHSSLGIYGHHPHKLTVTRKTEEEIITRKIACMPVKPPTRDWQVNTFQTEKIKYAVSFIEIPRSFFVQIRVNHGGEINFMTTWISAKTCENYPTSDLRIYASSPASNRIVHTASSTSPLLVLLGEPALFFLTISAAQTVVYSKATRFFNIGTTLSSLETLRHL